MTRGTFLLGCQLFLVTASWLLLERPLPRTLSFHFYFCHTLFALPHPFFLLSLCAAFEGSDCVQMPECSFPRGHHVIPSWLLILRQWLHLWKVLSQPLYVPCLPGEYPTLCFQVSAVCHSLDNPLTFQAPLVLVILLSPSLVWQLHLLFSHPCHDSPSQFLKIKPFSFLL